MNKKPVITIIGAGPGGYEAAIYAARMGATVNLIEEDKLGGTCLNRGCIPTKVYLNTANKIKEVTDLKALNIDTDAPEFTFKNIVERKNKNITQLRKGIESLLEENGVNYIKGRARLVNEDEIAVTNEDKTFLLETEFTLLATGSSPVIPEDFNYNGRNIISTDEFFELEELPESIIIIGGGIAAIEISQLLARFKVKVTLIEIQDHILPNEDQDIVRRFNRILKKDKIQVKPKTGVKKITDCGDSVEVRTNKGNFKAEMALICIGRKPNTENIFNSSLGIKLNDNGTIQVDENLKTDVDSIYAAGDIVNSPMLAYVATHESITAIKNILGEKESINYKAIPNTIFTEPEIASVGIKEDELKEKKVVYRKGTFPFRLLGKSLTLNRTEGFVKILTDENRKILGASIYGTHASDLIMELVLALELNLTTDELTRLVYPHPSLSEAVLEAARDVSDISINKL